MNNTPIFITIHGLNMNQSCFDALFKNLEGQKHIREDIVLKGHTKNGFEQFMKIQAEDWLTQVESELSFILQKYTNSKRILICYSLGALLAKKILNKNKSLSKQLESIHYISPAFYLNRRSYLVKLLFPFAKYGIKSFNKINRAHPKTTINAYKSLFELIKSQNEEIMPSKTHIYLDKKDELISRKKTVSNNDEKVIIFLGKIKKKGFYHQTIENHSVELAERILLSNL